MTRLEHCASLRKISPVGRELEGIHFAVEFPPRRNRRVAGLALDGSDEIVATGTRVAIAGGGDTGADCLGTSHRQKALSADRLEIMSAPPESRSPRTPWASPVR